MSLFVDESLFTLIGAAIIIAVVLGLIVYTYNRLNRDFEAYQKNRASILEASAVGDPEDGADGTDGKSAYEIYKEVNNDPDITLSEYEALFIGTDGMPGMNAPPAVNGSNGDDGSTGMHGAHGLDGSQGAAGKKGLAGVEGDSFLTVYVSSVPADDIAQDTGTSAAPADYPSCEFITTTTSSGQIRYFYNKTLLTTINITSWGKISGNENGYVSFILYDDTSTIIGLTAPVALDEYDPDSLINFTVTETRPLKYRVILSLNRSLTMSSFTSNIIEKNLEDKEFIYVRNPDPDPFIQGFYDVIAGQPALYHSSIDFLEKSKISKAEQSNISPIKLGV